MKSLGENLSEGLAGKSPSSEPDPAASCPCGGPAGAHPGWVYEDDGGAGRARPCRCHLERLALARMQRAEIPARYLHCTLDSFEGLGNPSLLAALAKARRYVDGFLSPIGLDVRDSGLLFDGPTGTGKTHLAIAVLRAVIERYGVNGRYVDFSVLIAQIKASYDDGSEESADRILRDYLDAEVLVLDELGAASPTGHTKEQLYLLLNGRYTKRRPTLFTTNYPIEGRSRQGFEPLRERVSIPVMSRLQEMAHVVQVDGEDYRVTHRRPSAS